MMIHHQHSSPHAATTPEDADDDGGGGLGLGVYIDIIDRNASLVSPLTTLLPSICSDNTTSTSVVGSASSSVYSNSNSHGLVEESLPPRPRRYSYYPGRSKSHSISNNSSNSSSLLFQFSASSSSRSRSQHSMQHTVASTTSSSNNNHNNTNNNSNSMNSSALQYANPKHFNAYYGVPMNKNNTAAGGTTSSTSASLANNNPTSSSSPTSQQRQQQHQQRRIELTQKLSQYTRQNDRRQLLRALTDTKLFPRMHGPLPTVYGVEDIAMAEREAAGERASLNGVKFLQVKPHSISNSSATNTTTKSGEPNTSNNGPNTAPLDSYFLQTLREVCGHMCEMDAVDADPMALYGGLLLRLCRSASEQDALAVLSNYLCCGSKSGELILLPLKRRHHETTNTATPAAAAASAAANLAVPLSMAVPLELDLYVESGNIHAKVTMRHELGLFKRSDLEAAGLQKELSPWNALVMLIMQQQQQQQGQLPPTTTTMKNPSSSSEMKQLSHIQYNIVSSSKFNKIRPWAYIDADVVERINFGSGCSVRMLHVSVPEDKNSGYVKK